MSDEASAERVSRFFDSLAQSSLRTIDDATIPIQGMQDNEVKHDRTAVLYEIADHHFLLTAAHCLRDYRTYKIPLFVPRLNGGIIPLTDVVIHSTEEDGRDVAAIHLDSSTANLLAAEKSFVHHNSILLGDNGKGLYALLGYPMDWFQTNEKGYPSLTCLAFAGFPYSGNRPDNSNFIRNVHFEIGFERDAIIAANRQPVSLPRVQGMSGCGIWKVADFREDDAPHLIKPQLVAIQHTWVKGKAVRGTIISYVLKLLLDAYPELHKPMDLAYPR